MVLRRNLQGRPFRRTNVYFNLVVSQRVRQPNAKMLVADGSPGLGVTTVP